MFYAFVSYLAISVFILASTGAYMVLPAPSRLVKQKDGYYKYKDYVPMPHWLWCIVLTAIWIPYLVWLLIELRKGGFKL